MQTYQNLAGRLVAEMRATFDTDAVATIETSSCGKHANAIKLKLRKGLDLCLMHQAVCRVTEDYAMLITRQQSSVVSILLRSLQAQQHWLRPRVDISKKLPVPMRAMCLRLFESFQGIKVSRRGNTLIVRQWQKIFLQPLVDEVLVEKNVKAYIGADNSLRIDFIATSPRNSAKKRKL